MPNLHFFYLNMKTFKSDIVNVNICYNNQIVFFFTFEIKLALILYFFLFLLDLGSQVYTRDFNQHFSCPIMHAIVYYLFTKLAIYNTGLFFLYYSFILFLYIPRGHEKKKKKTRTGELLQKQYHIQTKGISLKVQACSI